MKDVILKYEEKIKNSPLFSIDKEKFSNNYKTEARKLVENLFLYLKACKSKNEEYGYEIFKVSELCIKNYDSSKGSFLNYFNKAWAEEFRHLQAKAESQETVNVIHMPDEKQRAFKKFLQYKKSTGRDIKSPEFWKGLEEILSLQEIEEVKKIYIHRTIPIDQQKGDKECNLLEQMASSGISPKEKFENEEKGKLLIDIITGIYNKCQQRQKLILSVLLTTHLASKITSEIPLLLEYLKKQPFFHYETYQHCIQSNSEIEHKEIAIQFHVKEESLSRTWKDFKEKITKKIEMNYE